jgi:hypothetical protein
LCIRAVIAPLPLLSIVNWAMQLRVQRGRRALDAGAVCPLFQETTMAKGQQRSGREPKKPKAEKPKPSATSSFADKSKSKSGK